MKWLIVGFLFLIPSPTAACEFQAQLGKNTNPVPAQWAISAARKHSLCGTLISTRTQHNGKHDSLHKLGARDTIILVPNDISVSRPPSVEIIYWFHGCGGFSQRSFQTRLIPQWSRILRETSHRPIIVVSEMPWSTNTRTRCGRQGRVWNKKNQFFLYTQEIETLISHHLRLGVQFKRVIMGHSAGGSAIASAAVIGGLCKAMPQAVIFSDAVYGNWFGRSWRGCLRQYKKKHDARIIVLNVPGGKPWRAFRKWSKRSRRDALKVESPRLRGKWRHALVGDNALLFYYGYFPNFTYRSI